MFIRQFFQKKNGKRHAYWALVESYRAERGPRQRVVAWLGRLDEAERLGVRQAAEEPSSTSPAGKQQTLFDQEAEETEPRWVEVNASKIASNLAAPGWR